MGAFISALGYAWLSHGLAFLTMPRMMKSNYWLRAIAIWAFAALVLFIIQDWMAVMAVVALAAVLFAPREPSKRVAFFVSIAPCLPVYLTAPLPFPGINFLLEASHYKLLAVFLLLPVFFLAVVRTIKRLELSGLMELGSPTPVWSCTLGILRSSPPMLLVRQAV